MYTCVVASCMCANVTQARPSHASPASTVAQAISSSCKRVIIERVADCRTQSGVMMSPLYTRITNNYGLVTECRLTAAPWCVGFHVRDENDMDGMARRPDERSMTEWLDVVIEAIEKGWDTKNGWAPSRSLTVKWEHDEGPYFHAAEVIEQLMHVKVDMKKQIADELREAGPYRDTLMTDWCNDHWKFMTMCWERCSLKYRPQPGEPTPNANSRKRFLEFMRDENKEHEEALAMADQWWLTYYEILEAPLRDDRGEPPARVKYRRVLPHQSVGTA